MRFFEEAANCLSYFFSGAAHVKSGIDQAKQLVAQGKLDEAVALVRNLEKKYPSNSTGGIIATEFDPICDQKQNEMSDLINADNSAEVLALYREAPGFYGEMGAVKAYLAAYPEVELSVSAPKA